MRTCKCIQFWVRFLFLTDILHVLIVVHHHESPCVAITYACYLYTCLHYELFIEHFLENKFLLELWLYCPYIHEKMCIMQFTSYPHTLVHIVVVAKTKINNMEVA